MNMKVILNKDISPLGEEGDVKEVAKGYARNFLLPRGIALRYTERTARLFESRKGEIDERKKLKRDDAASVKERLEALELSIAMPAGANGKLYGAVTSQTVVDELSKQGFQIERKRIEIPGNSIKSTGKYKFTVKLYGNTTAELFINIAAQKTKTAAKEPPVKDRQRRTGEGRNENAAGAGETQGGDIASEGKPPEGEQAASTPETASVPKEAASAPAADTVPETASVPEEAASAPETASAPKEAASAPETASVPKEAASAPETASVPKEAASAPAAASVPEEAASAPAAASVPEEAASAPETASVPEAAAVPEAAK